VVQFHFDMNCLNIGKFSRQVESDIFRQALDLESRNCAFMFTYCAQVVLQACGAASWPLEYPTAVGRLAAVTRISLVAFAAAGRTPHFHPDVQDAGGRVREGLGCHRGADECIWLLGECAAEAGDLVNWA
jgi:hypothetical protein